MTLEEHQDLNKANIAEIKEMINTLSKHIDISISSLNAELKVLHEKWNSRHEATVAALYQYKDNHQKEHKDLIETVHAQELNLGKLSVETKIKLGIWGALVFLLSVVTSKALEMFL